MKTVIYILITLGVVIYAGEVSVSFKPFSISIPQWRLLLAMICFFVGFTLYGANEYAKGRAGAYKEIRDKIEEVENERE